MRHPVACWMAILLLAIPVLFSGVSIAKLPLFLTHLQAQEKPPTKKLLFFFTAAWCSPCKEIKPEVERLVKRNEEQVELIWVDFDEQGPLTDLFKITTLPTLILVDSDGGLVIRIEGATREGLKALRTSLGESAEEEDNGSGP